MKGKHDMTDDTNDSLWQRCVGVTPKDRRNQRLFMGVSLAWAVGFVGISKLIELGALPAGPLAWTVAAIPTLLGIAVIVVYARFLRQADELQRLIQLEALALGFGGGLFALLGYRVFERLGAPPLALDDATMVLVALYVLGIVLGLRRYR